MESKVGLYSTLIFHLIVLIILLAFSIQSIVSKESSFVLDFSKQEKIEKEIQVEQMKADVSKELDAMLSSNYKAPVRNVAVDAGEKLKDDRHKNPAEVYKDAEKLQDKLDAAKKKSLALDKEDAENYAMSNKVEKKSTGDNSSYNGPSVISYLLEGRKARYLPVPAYKGYGSGRITVEIKVNRKGRVTEASVIESVSSNDTSLWSFAIEAAKRSRFTASTTAPEIQIGEIVYEFIAQ